MKRYISLDFSSWILALLLVIATGLSGCYTCEDCEPIDDEPYVNLHFYSKASGTAIAVAIREFNSQPGEEILYYQDTTDKFILPLDMWSDSSFVVLKYVSSEDYEQEIIDSLHLMYERSLETTEKNFVKMVDLNTSVIDHTFDSLVLVCKDTVGICTSNESTLKVYF